MENANTQQPPAVSREAPFIAALIWAISLIYLLIRSDPFTDLERVFFEWSLAMGSIFFVMAILLLFVPGLRRVQTSVAIALIGMLMMMIINLYVLCLSSGVID